MNLPFLKEGDEDDILIKNFYIILIIGFLLLLIGCASSDKLIIFYSDPEEQYELIPSKKVTSNIGFEISVLRGYESWEEGEILYIASDNEKVQMEIKLIQDLDLEELLQQMKYEITLKKRTANKQNYVVVDEPFVAYNAASIGIPYFNSFSFYSRERDADIFIFKESNESIYLITIFVEYDHVYKAIPKIKAMLNTFIIVDQKDDQLPHRTFPDYQGQDKRLGIHI